MAILKKLYREIKELGVVTSQREFSGLWGKQPSWCSTSMTRHRSPGLDALVRFHMALDDMERDSNDAANVAEDNEAADAYRAGAGKLAELKSEIWTEITSVARAAPTGHLR